MGFLDASALPFVVDSAYAIQVIAVGSINGSSQHDLVYDFLLQQFSPAKGDPADDPENKKKMLIMVSCGLGLVLPLILFKVFRDYQDKKKIEEIKAKAQAQI